MLERLESHPRTQSTLLPKYRQVEEDLRYRVLSGMWKPGDQIPTEGELCSQYNVSRITIRRAILDLAVEGYLFSVSGKGTFVAEWQDDTDGPAPLKSFTNEMQELGYKAVTVAAELEVIEANKGLAGILGIAQGDKAIELRRVRAIQTGVVIGYSVNTFPLRPGLSTNPDDYLGSLYGYLEGYGIFFTSARDYLEATLPPPDVAERLGITPSEPVLRSVKISRTPDRSFAEYNICYYVGSRYRYYVTY